MFSKHEFRSNLLVQHKISLNVLGQYARTWNCLVGFGLIGWKSWLKNTLIFKKEGKERGEKRERERERERFMHNLFIIDFENFLCKS